MARQGRREGLVTQLRCIWSKRKDRLTAVHPVLVDERARVSLFQGCAPLSAYRSTMGGNPLFGRGGHAAWSLMHISRSLSKLSRQELLRERQQ